MQGTKRRFLSDKRGIFWVNVIGMVIIFVAVTVWIVLAFVLNTFLDEFAPHIEDIPQGLLVSDSIRNQGGIIVVVIVLGTLLWMFASSFMRERQEVPIPY
jgi:hypothetical protein